MKLTPYLTAIEAWRGQHRSYQSIADELLMQGIETSHVTVRTACIALGCDGEVGAQRRPKRLSLQQQVRMKAQRAGGMMVKDIAAYWEVSRVTASAYLHS